LFGQQILATDQEMAGSLVKTLEGGSGPAAAALGAGLLGSGKAFGQGLRIPGFEQARDYESDKPWEPVSDRKIRVWIFGYGVCRFGAAFGDVRDIVLPR
jgi:hypothetical protein